MSKPPFQQVEKLFHEALGVPPAERAAFLDAACRESPELRAVVEDLLQHTDAGDETDDFLVSPVADDSALLRLFPTLSLRKSPSPVPAPPPVIVPGYQLLEEIGRGGMGVVYKVRQTSLNRIVALKMLLPGNATPDLLARFRTEAEALARLQHPNIVTIYDIGELDGRPYFTMELVAGPNLARLIDGRPQDVATSARLVEVLARTMDAVHQTGILHRDLKPANILLQIPHAETQRRREEEKKTEAATDASQTKELVGPGLHSSSVLCVSASLREVLFPKITDFGLAKDQAAVGKLTQTGIIMGTPSYMAPEQARKTTERLGPGADIYALGAILYELLTGRPPFQGDTTAETVAQLLFEEPLSPARLRPKLPRDLVTICLKCLEKSPRKRYATALDLAEDLRRFQAGEPIRSRPVGPLERGVRWCRRHPLVAALLLLSAALVMGLVCTVIVYEARLEQEAEAMAELRRRQVVQLQFELALSAEANGDTFLAVLRLTEALRLDAGHADREQEDRARIAAALRHSPRLIDLRPLDGHPLDSHLPADYRRAVTTELPGAVQVRDPATGRTVIPRLRHCGPGTIAAFSGDGTTITVVAPQGLVSVWKLPVGEDDHFSDQQAARPLAELIALAQVLAAGRINEEEHWERLEPQALQAAWKELQGPG
jgi:serine/threonine protein kinase